jgi:hypothetical protein
MELGGVGIDIALIDAYLLSQLDVDVGNALYLDSQ